MRSDIKKVLEDCSRKFELFLKHQMRCFIQEEQRQKMKLEPTHYRKKTNEFYSQKGMSWHGSVVQFRRRVTGGEMDKADKSNRK